MVVNTTVYLQTYIANGFKVFPCLSRDSSTKSAKAPFTNHGFKDATDDLNQVQKWIDQYPDCAWGIATTSERAVLDVDPKNGGDKTLEALLAQHGQLPKTWLAETGSGGWHNWFEFPNGDCIGNNVFGTGLDFKGLGGFVVVPPSRIWIPNHHQAYKWVVSPWSMPIAKAPAYLIDLLALHQAEKGSRKSSSVASQKAAAPVAWVVEPDGFDLASHPGSPEGSRREDFNHLAGIHLARGDNLKTIYALAEAWANRCPRPFTGNPHPNDHWKYHLDRLVAKEMAKRAERGQHIPPSFAPKPVAPEPVGKEIINSSATEQQPQTELIISFPTPTEPKGGSGICCQQPTIDPIDQPTQEPIDQQPIDPLTLHPDAYYGLMGEMLKAIEPETEGSPPSILLTWLTLFGCAIGRNAWFQIGARRHHPILFTANVGRSSDAKGDSWSVGLYPFQAVCQLPIANGVGSGEGLIERIQDEHITTDAKGKTHVIPGVEDKRLVVRLSELSRCFKVGRREGNTLSEYIREAWDGDRIQVTNRSTTALSTTGYSVSVAGDITPTVLDKLLGTGTEAWDGFSNRFLWCICRSLRSLPSGGNITVLDPFTERLKAVLEKALTIGEMRRSQEAERLWESVYESLKVSGDDVPHTDRARPYVVRLSMLYALADGSKVIDVCHLRAALAVWEYCRQSAKALFSQAPTPEPPTPDPLHIQLLNAIPPTGVKRSELSRQFRSHNSEAIGQALEYLRGIGLAHPIMEMAVGAGRPTEKWFPGSGSDPDPNGSDPNGLLPRFDNLIKYQDKNVILCADCFPCLSNNVDNIIPPSTCPDANGGSANAGKEIMNSASAPTELFPSTSVGKEIIQTTDPQATELIISFPEPQTPKPLDTSVVEYVVPDDGKPMTESDKLIQTTIVQNGDLRLENGKVVWRGLTKEQIDWCRRHPRRTEAIAKHKSKPPAPALTIAFDPELDKDGKLLPIWQYDLNRLHNGQPPTKEWATKTLWVRPEGSGIRIKHLYPPDYPVVAQWCQENAEWVMEMARESQASDDEFNAILDEVWAEDVPSE